MGLVPGSQAPPMPSYLPPACLTMVCTFHTAIAGSFGFQVSRRGREGRDQPMCAGSYTPVLAHLLLNTAHLRCAIHWRSQVRAWIYSQLRRGCSSSMKSTCRSREELAGRSSLNLWSTQEQVAPIPRTGTRHLFQNVESGSPPHRHPDWGFQLSYLGFCHKMFSPSLVMGVRHKSVYVAVWVSLIQPERQMCRCPRLLLQLWLRKALFLAHKQTPILTPCTHVHTVFSSHTYPVLFSDLDCEQLCS